MSFYGRFFKPEEKTDMRRILDRVAGMTILDCRAYIQSELDAMRELYKKENDKGTLVYDKEANKRHESEHRPLLDYIDAVIEKTGHSTEGDIQAHRDMQCIKDLIASDIYSVYQADGYGNTRYDDIKVMDILLDDTSRNITMWPMMRWASTWNPKMKGYQELYDKYVDLHWKLDKDADDYDENMSVDLFERHHTPKS